METSSHPTPTVNEVRFFLNQFRKGDVNDIKYRKALVDTFVNKIYLYNDKMTVLYNTQDSHSDVTIDDLSSSRVALVEAGGVEPPSENTSSGTSPGADGCLHSRAMTQAVMLHALVASLVMPGAKLTPVTCTTQVTPKPGSWSFRGGRPLIKQRRELRCRCSLIYKLPVFRMSGASARYSRTHVPVETSTPPNRLLEWGRQVVPAYGAAVYGGGDPDVQRRPIPKVGLQPLRAP